MSALRRLGRRHERGDVKFDGHDYRWYGDGPYLICHYCNRIIDKDLGRVIREGNGICPESCAKSASSTQRSD